MTSLKFAEPGDAVLYEKSGQVVTITLNRPGTLNAINRQLRSELGGAIEKYDQDDEARVAIITGAGRAFCAGRDLKERADDNAAGVKAHARDSTSSPERPFMWPQTWKPLIAAINGFALAGGWSIAQLCDIRIAAEDAKLGITESRVGLLPPFAVMLPKMLSMAGTMELVLTGDAITAQRAYDIGFVNKVVPADSLMDEAMNMASKIIANAPLSVRYFKELAIRSMDMSAESASILTYNMYNQLLQSEDSVEGPRAFAEKRPPQWKGR